MSDRYRYICSISHIKMIENYIKLIHVTKMEDFNHVSSYCKLFIKLAWFTFDISHCDTDLVELLGFFNVLQHRNNAASRISYPDVSKPTYC